MLTSQGSERRQKSVALRSPAFSMLSHKTVPQMAKPVSMLRGPAGLYDEPRSGQPVVGSALRQCKQVNPSIDPTRSGASGLWPGRTFMQNGPGTISSVWRLADELPGLNGVDGGPVRSSGMQVADQAGGHVGGDRAPAGHAATRAILEKAAKQLDVSMARPGSASTPVTRPPCSTPTESRIELLPLLRSMWHWLRRSRSAYRHRGANCHALAAVRTRLQHS